MPHHYPKSTVQAEAWCPTCGKPTPHYVYDGRLGRCMNEHPHAEREAAPPAAEQMGMFSDYTVFPAEPEPAKPLTEDELWGGKL